MKQQLIDQIRDVPETATRLYLGATVARDDGHYRIEMDGQVVRVAPEVYDVACDICRAMQVRPRRIEFAGDVLELRHAAEDFFLDSMFNADGKKPSVLFVPAGLTASGYYRAMIPSDLMGEGGRVIAHFTHRLDISKALRYDVLWVQLVTDPLLLQIVRKAKESGSKIVYDIDDRLDSIPTENQASAVYGTPEKQAEIKAMLELADCVTVSTAPLAEYIRQFAKNVRVLPNMITANVMPRRHTPDPAYTRILWAGSPTHKRDLDIFAPALRDVLLGGLGAVRFTCFGERLPPALADAYKYIDLVRPVDFEDYHDTLAEVKADFAVAPLEDNTFNKSKSAVKSLEYAAAGYPMLLSPVGEYPEVVAAGLPAILVPDNGWKEAFDLMIGMGAEKRNTLSKAVINWVCQHRCIAAVKAAPWTEVVLDLVSASAKKEV